MRSYTLLNTIAFVAVLVVNYLSNSLPLHGKTPAQLSDQYPNLFVPAGLTFAIWGVIYTWLLVWVGAQVIALFNTRLQQALEAGVQKVGYWFAGTCVLNIAWLLAWHWEQLPLSVGIMVVLLATLWQLNRRAGVGSAATNAQEKWLAHAPFGLYQGWITIALIANVTAFLVSVGWSGAGIAESSWATLMLVAGTLIATTVIRKTDNVFHGLAVAWALLGVYLKRHDAGDPESLLPARIALLSLVIVLIWVGLRGRRWLAY